MVGSRSLWRADWPQHSLPPLLMLPLHCPSLVFEPLPVPALCTLSLLLSCLYVFLVLYPQIHSNGPGLGFDFHSCTLELGLKAHPFSCHMRSPLVGTSYSTTATPSESARSVSCASLMLSAFVVSPHCCLAGGFSSQPSLMSLVYQGSLGDAASVSLTPLTFSPTFRQRETGSEFTSHGTGYRTEDKEGRI